MVVVVFPLSRTVFTIKDAAVVLHSPAECQRELLVLSLLLFNQPLKTILFDRGFAKSVCDHHGWVSLERSYTFLDAYCCWFCLLELFFGCAENDGRFNGTSSYVILAYAATWGGMYSSTPDVPRLLSLPQRRIPVRVHNSENITWSHQDCYAWWLQWFPAYFGAMRSLKFPMPFCTLLNHM